MHLLKNFNTTYDNDRLCFIYFIPILDPVRVYATVSFDDLFDSIGYNKVSLLVTNLECFILALAY